MSVAFVNSCISRLLKGTGPVTSNDDTRRLSCVRGFWLLHFTREEVKLATIGGI